LIYADFYAIQKSDYIIVCIDASQIFTEGLNMKFSYLIRRRRKRLVNDDKGFKGDGESGSSWLGLTKIETGDKIKKERDVYGFDQEGNIKKIAARYNTVPGKLNRKLGWRKRPVEFGYLNIGYYLVTPIVAGVFLGLGLDYWLKTKPFFVVFFLFLGTLGSFYNLFKLLK